MLHQFTTNTVAKHVAPRQKKQLLTIGRQGCRSHPTKEWEVFVLTGAVVCFFMASWQAGT